MVYKTDEIIIFGKGNPAIQTELGIVLTRDEETKQEFIARNRKKLTIGRNNPPITTTSVHTFDFEKIHKPNNRTSWLLPKIEKEAPDWKLPIGHPERCKGLCIDTMSQCPRPNKSGRSLCSVCLGEIDMGSIYADSSTGKVKELIGRAEERRKEIGTSLNDEIDYLRAQIGVILELKTKLETSDIDADAKKELKSEIEDKVNATLKTVSDLVVQQGKLESSNSVPPEMFSRVIEGAIADYKRSFIDDMRGSLPADSIRILEERHKETAMRIIDSVVPGAEVAKGIPEALQGNLLEKIVARNVRGETEPVTITIT